MGSLTNVTHHLDSVLCSNIGICLLHRIKVETQSYKMTYHTLHLRKQWESNYALKVDQLVNSFNVLVQHLESPSLSTLIPHCSHPLKP